MSFNQSLCGCFDDTKQCCDTWCCPCCQVGRQFSALEGNPDTHNCLMCCVAFCCFSCMPCVLRCKVSDKYQLGESSIVSCLLGCCCPSCSLCQTGRELNYRGVNPGGFCCSPPNKNEPAQVNAPTTV